MGVQRFHAAEEMNASVPLPVRDGGFERFVRRCARYWRLAPRVYPRGVVRFRSIEEAQQAREQVARENAQRTRRHDAEPE